MQKFDTSSANNFWAKLKKSMYEHYGQESGKMLVHAGVITWIASCASQVAAIVFNDKIPSDQKKFLIPQEIADGALNVLTFYLITNTMKNVAGKLVSTGKWSTKAIRDFVAKNDVKNELKMGEMQTDIAGKFRENKEFHESYDKFKGGMDMIAATAGSVVSCNIITPVIRNYIGAKEQKADIAREKMKINQTLPVTSFSTGMKI